MKSLYALRGREVYLFFRLYLELGIDFDFYIFMYFLPWAILLEVISNLSLVHKNLRNLSDQTSLVLVQNILDCHSPSTQWL